MHRIIIISSFCIYRSNSSIMTDSRQNQLVMPEFKREYILPNILYTTDWIYDLYCVLPQIAMLNCISQFKITSLDSQNYLSVLREGVMDPKSTSTVLQCSAHYKDWLDLTFYHLVSKTCLSIFLWIYDCLKLLLKHIHVLYWLAGKPNEYWLASAPICLAWSIQYW